MRYKKMQEMVTSLMAKSHLSSDEKKLLVMGRLTDMVADTGDSSTPQSEPDLVVQSMTVDAPVLSYVLRLD